MKKYLALLRGINVGGQKKILMVELQKLFEEMGFLAVQTYIQSGNVVFETFEQDTKILEQSISQKIAEKYAFQVLIFIRDKEQMHQILRQNPFENTQDLYVSFLDKTILETALEKLDVEKYLPDQVQIFGKTLYLSCQTGYGKTKLNNQFFEKKLQVNATTRNWKSVCELTKMLEK